MCRGYLLGHVHCIFGDETGCSELDFRLARNGFLDTGRVFVEVVVGRWISIGRLGL